jgi:hypothetical protein
MFINQRQKHKLGQFRLVKNCAETGAAICCSAPKLSSIFWIKSLGGQLVLGTVFDAG